MRSDFYFARHRRGYHSERGVVAVLVMLSPWWFVVGAWWLALWELYTGE